MKKLDPRSPLVESAARIISVRLDELRSFAPRALAPENVIEQHDMRIAAKRLRYILEATGFCFGKPAQKAARRAHALQDLLGEMHDCDVMLPRIEGHLADLRAEDSRAIREGAGDSSDLEPALAAHARNRRAYRGLEVLTVYTQARRQLMFDRFVAFWEEQERAGTWGRLERAVRQPLREAKARRRHARQVEKARHELQEDEHQQRLASKDLWGGYSGSGRSSPGHVPATRANDRRAP